MTHAERCPVCNGNGKVYTNTNCMGTDPIYWQQVTCHGCNGKGWVEINDNAPPYIPYVPYNPWYPQTGDRWTITCTCDSK
jgi:hypothetical protein